MSKIRLSACTAHPDKILREMTVEGDKPPDYQLRERFPYRPQGKCYHHLAVWASTTPHVARCTLHAARCTPGSRVGCWCCVYICPQHAVCEAFVQCLLSLCIMNNQVNTVSAINKVFKSLFKRKVMLIVCILHADQCCIVRFYNNGVALCETFTPICL